MSKKTKKMKSLMNNETNVIELGLVAPDEWRRKSRTYEYTLEFEVNDGYWYGTINLRAHTAQEAVSKFRLEVASTIHGRVIVKRVLENVEHHVRYDRYERRV